MLGEFRRVLRPGGALVLETMHRDRLMTVLDERGWDELPDGAIRLERRAFDSVEGVVEAALTCWRKGGDPTTVEYRLRVYTATELARMAAEARLRGDRVLRRPGRWSVHPGEPARSRCQDGLRTRTKMKPCAAGTPWSARGGVLVAPVASATSAPCVLASHAPRTPRRRSAIPVRVLRSSRGLAGLDPHGRDRAVPVRGRLCAPRRAGPPAAGRRRAGLPLRRGRRPLRRADHDRARSSSARSRRSSTRPAASSTSISWSRTRSTTSPR